MERRLGGGGGALVLPGDDVVHLEERTANTQSGVEALAVVGRRSQPFSSFRV